MCAQVIDVFVEILSLALVMPAYRISDIPYLKRERRHGGLLLEMREEEGGLAGSLKVLDTEQAH